MTTTVLQSKIHNIPGRNTGSLTIDFSILFTSRNGYVMETSYYTIRIFACNKEVFFRKLKNNSYLVVFVPSFLSIDNTQQAYGFDIKVFSELVLVDSCKAEQPCYILSDIIYLL